MDRHHIVLAALEAMASQSLIAQDAPVAAIERYAIDVSSPDLTQRLMLEGDAVRARSVLPLSMSWDHRALDGALAARFLVQLAKLLADVRRMLL